MARFVITAELLTAGKLQLNLAKNTRNSQERNSGSH